MFHISVNNRFECLTREESSSMCLNVEIPNKHEAVNHEHFSFERSSEQDCVREGRSISTVCKNRTAKGILNGSGDCNLKCSDLCKAKQSDVSEDRTDHQEKDNENVCLDERIEVSGTEKNSNVPTKPLVGVVREHVNVLENVIMCKPGDNGELIDKNGQISTNGQVGEDVEINDLYINLNDEGNNVQHHETPVKEHAGIDNGNKSDSLCFKYKLVQLNVNGWNNNNGYLREQILAYSEADFICVNETHLKGNEQLTLPGYQWIGMNRKMQHVNAVRAFGGVGLFFSNNISNEFTCKILDKSFEGILTVLFEHKVSGFRLVVSVCYLPPEHSKWGRDGVAFFSHLLNELYRYENIDLYVLTGDLNARSGKLNDIIESIDNMKCRNVIDEKVNHHGNAFIEYLQEACLCMLNGRFDPAEDGFTSVSTRGSAVVDYIVTNTEKLDSFCNFKVESCIDIVNKSGLKNFVNTRSRIPDHAMLSCEFSISVNLNTPNAPKDNNYSNESFQRFHVNEIPNDFLSSAESARYIINLIQQVELCRETQNEIDKLYENICSFIISEMKDKLRPKIRNENLRKRHKPRKPFWNEELEYLFKEMASAEKAFRKCSLRYLKRNLRLQFKESRHKFDRCFRKIERQFKRGQLLDIEYACSENPNDFWKYLQNLGPRRHESIPMEVYNDQNEIVCDVETVLDSWEKSFSKLYSEPQFKSNETEANNLKINIHMSEQIMLDPLYSQSNILNKDFTLDEIKSVVRKSKFRKAVGIDMIPNEV